MILLLIGLAVAATWAAFTWLGGWIASEKGRDPSQGYLLGFFLGLFGVMIVLFLPDGTYQAPVRRDDLEEDDPDPDWQALGVKLSPPPAPETSKPFTLPPPTFRGLRDE